MTVNSPTEIPDLGFRAGLQQLDATSLLLKVEDEVDWDLGMDPLWNPVDPEAYWESIAEK